MIERILHDERTRRARRAARIAYGVASAIIMVVLVLFTAARLLRSIG